MSRRSWEFTLNNYTEEEENAIKHLAEGVSFLIFAHETGDNGTPHLQGRVVFPRTYRLAGIKERFKCFDRAHLEATKARDDLSYFYKTYDPNLFKKDNRKQGERSDLQLLGKHLQENDVHSTMVEFPREAIKYANGIKQLKVAFESVKKKTPPLVIWIHGPTGTGKTKAVHDLESGNRIYMMEIEGSFFSDYHHEEVAIWDDFRGEDVKYNKLLRLLHEYNVSLNCKGYIANFTPKRIYITSDRPYTQCVCAHDPQLTQLKRRIHWSLHIDEIKRYEKPVADGGDLWRVIGDLTQYDETSENELEKYHIKMVNKYIESNGPIWKDENENEEATIEANATEETIVLETPPPANQEENLSLWETLPLWEEESLEEKEDYEDEESENGSSIWEKMELWSKGSQCSASFQFNN